MRLRRALAAAAAALISLLAGAGRPAAAQTCGSIDVKANGAAGNGVTNDAPVFSSMDSNSAVGLLYMPAGTYRISSGCRRPPGGAAAWGCRL